MPLGSASRAASLGTKLRGEVLEAGGVAGSRALGVNLSRAKPRGTPDQCSLLCLAPTLDLILPFPRRRQGGMFFSPQQLHWAPPRSPIGTFAGVVFFKSVLWILS